MNKALVRTIVLILVFFGALFVLREPLRNLDSNLALLKYQYLNPVIAYIKGETDTSATSSPYVAFDENGQPIEEYKDEGDLGSSTDNPKPITVKNSVKDIIVATNNLLADSSSLSINGIVFETNKNRAKSNLPALKLNTALNKSAELKLQDMFTNQYFQHVSPKGLGVSDLVRKTGYEYIVVGENLALGNFGGDKQVVQAWMDSPGHRANILDNRFQEIGIAVGKGLYNGKEQWIAVQHFGKPLASCESPNYDLKEKIAYHTNELSAYEAELAAAKKEIDSSTDRGSAQEEKINKYNNMVGVYNTRLEGLKDEIATYNEQVRKFNVCAGLK